MERWESNLLKIIKIEFPNVSVKDAERSFLLPDGTFVATKKNDYEEDRYNPHYSIDNWMGNCIFDFTHHSWDEWRWDDEEDKKQKMEKYQLTEKDFEEIYENIDWEQCGKEYGSPILQHLGCIRLNGEREFYMVIPERNEDYIPTEVQLRKLYEWLEEFCDSLSTKRNKPFEIDINGEYDYAEYDTMNDFEIDPKYIYQKVLKYYRSGKLEENLEKID